jgi:multiple sugar transport system substrate-binding protein
MAGATRRHAVSLWPLALALTSAGGAVGCSQSAASGGTAAATATTGATAAARPQLRSGVTLSLMTGVNQAVAEVQSGLVQRFEQQFPGLKIDHTPSTPDFDAKLLSLFAAGTPPDVFWTSIPNTAGYASRNQLANLAPLLQRDRYDVTDFYEEALSVYRFGGKQAALPRDWPVRAVFYNVGAFQSAGVKLPPTTWTQGGWTYESFLDAAQRLIRNAPAGERYAAILSGGTSRYKTWTYTNGGELVSPDGKTCLLDQPRAVEALEFQAELIHRHGVAPTPQVIAEGGGEREMFQNGRVFMLEDTTGTTSLFRRIQSFEWDVTHMPVGKGTTATSGGGVGWTMPVQRPNENEAWELLKFLAGPEAVLTYARDGGVASPRASVAKHPQVLSQPPPKSTQIFADGGQYVRTTPGLPAWPQAEREIAGQIDRLLQSGENAQATAAAIVRAANPILRGG